ncbi:MAG TPA: hypothetical protein VIL20_27980 [Sandaracinaceae bacterium]
MQRAVIRAWLCAAWLLCAACSGANGSAEPRPRPEPERPVAPAREEEPAAPSLPDPDPASTCGRALACCRAYAAAIPDVVEDSACRGVREAASEGNADARCRAIAEGWRQALALRGGAPEECSR